MRFQNMRELQKAGKHLFEMPYEDAICMNDSGTGVSVDTMKYLYLYPATNPRNLGLIN